MTILPLFLSSYVCKCLIKGQNSQILRRPQDDIDWGRPLDDNPPTFSVILRPPKGLAVLSFNETFFEHGITANQWLNIIITVNNIYDQLQITIFSPYTNVLLIK